MKSILLVVQNLLKPYIDRKDRATQANIAPVETDATKASKAYSIGNQLILGDVLYDVTANIAKDDALTVGTNIAAADDITTQIKNHTVTTDAVPTKNSTNPVQSGGVYNSEKATREVIAPVEEDATSASQGYAQGAQLILGGVLYDVTATITQGDALTVGTNIAAADDVVTQLGSKAAGTDLTTLSGKAYQTDDTTESTLASNDVLPFYDTSATAKRKMSVQKFAEQLISNPNLLDNPWFTVNQRGQSSYSVDGAYFVDRFKSLGAPTIGVSNSGITITANANANGFRQILENDLVDRLLGKTVTLSIMLADGTIKSRVQTLPSAKPASWTEYATILVQTGVTMALFLGGNSAQFLQFYIANSGTNVSIKAVKLELGSVSTLAMDTAPNYATELLKCQRYFVRVKTNSNFGNIGWGKGSTDNKVVGSVVLPVQMRDTPTIAYSALAGFILTDTSNHVPTEIVLQALALNNAKINFVIDASTAGDMFQIMLTTTNDYLDFSADL